MTKVRRRCLVRYRSNDVHLDTELVVGKKRFVRMIENIIFSVISIPVFFVVVDFQSMTQILLSNPLNNQRNALPHANAHGA
jgi:hypothetical protein